MATREGIYVGGREIVERYVGSRLVWEKWVFVKKVDVREKVSVNEVEALKISLDVERKTEYNATGNLGYGKLTIVGRTVIVKSANADIYTNNWNNRSYYRVTLEFYNAADKNLVSSVSNSNNGFQFYSKEKKR